MLGRAQRFAQEAEVLSCRKIAIGQNVSHTNGEDDDIHDSRLRSTLTALSASTRTIATLLPSILHSARSDGDLRLERELAASGQDADAGA